MTRPISLRTVAGAVLIAVGAVALGGCVVAPIGPRGGYGYGYGPVVRIAPPALQIETVGVAPYPGQVWVGGYWGWSGNRHVWSPGRWEAPRQGYRWEPHRWEQHAGRDGGWRERPGRWERR